ncbi:unnamed protein product, partial [Adineta steineri]
TLIIIGTSFNVMTFVILCRAKFRDTKARPTLHYMRAMAVFDILIVDGTISYVSWLYTIYPLWDDVNLGVSNFLPLILMVIFNSGVIHHLIRLRRTTTVQNSQIKHRAISITLVITTFLFLIMTVPSSVAFAFFASSNQTLLHFLDCLMYSYYALSFPLY